MKWIIFFVLTAQQPKIDSITVTYDSVQAFGYTWTVHHNPGTFAEGHQGGDLLSKAYLEVSTKIDGTIVCATITVKYKKVIFHLQGDDPQLFIQLPHRDEYYLQLYDKRTKG